MCKIRNINIRVFILLLKDEGYLSKSCTEKNCPGRFRAKDWNGSFDIPRRTPLVNFTTADCWERCCRPDTFLEVSLGKFDRFLHLQAS